MVDLFEDCAFAYFTEGREDARQMLFEFEKGGPPWSALSVACELHLEVNRDEYSRAKDRARSRAHLFLRSRRRNLLRGTLGEKRSGSVTEWNKVNAAISARNKFSKKYKSSTLFYVGLSNFLLEQQRHSVVLRWCLDVAVIADAGTEQYIVDSARLLRDLHVSLVRQEDYDNNTVVLELSSMWSNSMLSRLVKYSSSSSATTKMNRKFVFVATSQSRPNIDGRSDETPPYLDLLALDCAHTLFQY